MPTDISGVTATHFHDGDDAETALTLDEAKVIACLGKATSIPQGEAKNTTCKLGDSEYKVIFTSGGSKLEIEVFNGTEFTLTDGGFFSSTCLYPLLATAAHGEAPTGGPCD